MPSNNKNKTKIWLRKLKQFSLRKAQVSWLWSNKNHIDLGLLENYMHKGVEFTPLPLDVEGPFEESFGVFAPLEGENWMENRPNGKADTPFLFGKFEWDPVPYEFDLEMDTEFFKSDYAEPLKEVELTLAELNDERPMSPLINPEMERLHRIATRAEQDLASPYATFMSPRKSLPFITLELSEQNIKKEAFPPSCERKARNEGVADAAMEGSRQCLENNPPATWTITQHSPAENTETDNTSFGEKYSSKHASTDEELKSNTGDQSSKFALGVKSELHATKAGTKIVEGESNVVVKTEREDEWKPEPASADEQEESADEEMMDSDDDFEVESHSPGSKNRKGRRGECDDLSPNPRRLLEISKELERLNKVIGDLKPIHQLPVNARTRSRKEKNKLASRACRLKKKAQYEANKLKLHGLEMERGRLLHLIENIKREILTSTRQEVPREGLGRRVEKMVQTALMANQMVAGRTTEFVESTLKATARANPWMGIREVHLNI